MLIALFVSAALTAQARDEMDGIRRRQIFEAARAATEWARWAANNLYPDLEIVQSTGRRRQYLQAMQDACRIDLRDAALHQVCRQYKISPKTLKQVMANPYDARKYKHRPEHPSPIRFGRGAPYWQRIGTAFNPVDVRLSPKLAKKYGYVNPPDQPEERIVGNPIRDELLKAGSEPIAKPEAKPEPTSLDDVLTPRPREAGRTGAADSSNP